MGQSNLLAPPLMRVGRVGRMPFAVDDDDGDLALALGERVAAGVEMGPERSRGLTMEVTACRNNSTLFRHLDVSRL
jgi:hypothetical protein